MKQHEQELDKILEDFALVNGKVCWNELTPLAQILLTWRNKRDDGLEERVRKALAKCFVGPGPWKAQVAVDAVLQAIRNDVKRCECGREIED